MCDNVNQTLHPHSFCMTWPVSLCPRKIKKTLSHDSWQWHIITIQLNQTKGLVTFFLSQHRNCKVKQKKKVTITRKKIDMIPDDYVEEVIKRIMQNKKTANLHTSTFLPQVRCHKCFYVHSSINTLETMFFRLFVSFYSLAVCSVVQTSLFFVI